MPQQRQRQDDVWKSSRLALVEDGIVKDHEIPSGWGLLVRAGSRLEVRRLPEFQETSENSKLQFLHRVAAAGTKSANRELGISYSEMEAERRGLDPMSESDR